MRVNSLHAYAGFVVPCPVSLPPRAINRAYSTKSSVLSLAFHFPFEHEGPQGCPVVRGKAKSKATRVGKACYNNCYVCYYDKYFKCYRGAYSLYSIYIEYYRHILLINIIYMIQRGASSSSSTSQATSTVGHEGPRGGQAQDRQEGRCPQGRQAQGSPKAAKVLKLGCKAAKRLDLALFTLLGFTSSHLLTFIYMDDTLYIILSR